MKFIALLILTLGLHLLLGWPWGVTGGVFAGWIWPVGGWWKAAVVVGSVWAVLVCYSVLVATGPSLELHRILGGLVGGIPGWWVPVIVIAIGVILGFAGGLVGYSVRRVAATVRT